MSSFVGVIPAAGRARRLPGLETSKEILEVRALGDSSRSGQIARPTCLHLTDAMALAGIDKCFIVLRNGKWDIPGCLAERNDVGMQLAYLVVGETPGVPWTLDAAFPYIERANVAFGFPDILTTCKDMYVQLCSKLDNCDADVVLAVFETDQATSVDVVSLTSTGMISEIRPKPTGIHFAKSWIAAVWRPTFTRYLHAYVSDSGGDAPATRETYLGDVIASSLAELKVVALEFPSERFLDVGTPENLRRQLDDSQSSDQGRIGSETRSPADSGETT